MQAANERSLLPQHAFSADEDRAFADLARDRDIDAVLDVVFGIDDDE